MPRRTRRQIEEADLPGMARSALWPSHTGGLRRASQREEAVVVVETVSTTERGERAHAGLHEGEALLRS
jgi:hypothetical protein